MLIAQTRRAATTVFYSATLVCIWATVWWAERWQPRLLGMAARKQEGPTITSRDALAPISAIGRAFANVWLSSRATLHWRCGTPAPSLEGIAFATLSTVSRASLAVQQLLPLVRTTVVRPCGGRFGVSTLGLGRRAGGLFAQFCDRKASPRFRNGQPQVLSQSVACLVRPSIPQR